MFSKVKNIVLISLTLTLLITLIIPQVIAQQPRVSAFVSTDSPIYTPGSKLVAEVFIYPQIDQELIATVRFSSNIPGLLIPDMTVRIPPVSEARFVKYESQPVSLPSNLADGTYYLNMEIWVGGGRIAYDTVDFWVRGGPPSGWEPMILFVWHNHQAPNYYPGLDFFSFWHIRHFYSDGLGIYYKLSDVYPNINWSDMGTYYLHYYMLTKYRNVKANHHYSPSLVYQLYHAYNTGFSMRDPKGTRVEVTPGSPLANVILDFFNGLNELANEGRVYLMTSCFAHTIMGYYMDRYDIPNLIRYDIELGMKWTERLLRETDAIWTPEMAWSNSLGSIYNELGLKITVLDGTHHFPGSIGDKSTIWEPYIFRDQNGREIIVFFRDQVVSDRDIGFTNVDWNDPRNADRDARALYYNIYNIHSFKDYDRRPIHVLAADGENWMLFAPSVANGALFLDRLYRYIDKMSELGIMETGTFKDALVISPPRRVLTSIPSTSWLGGWGKWTAEITDQAKAWSAMDEAMGKYKSLEYYYEVNDYSRYKEILETDSKFNTTAIALIHAMDSDFWWTEFFSISFINRWLEEFHKHANDMVKIDVNVEFDKGVLIKGFANEIRVTLKNLNPYVLRSTKFVVNLPGLNRTSMTVNLKQGEYVVLRLLAKPFTDSVTIIVSLSNPASRISGVEASFTVYSVEYEVYPAVDVNLSLTILTVDDVLVFDTYNEPGDFIFILWLRVNETPRYDVPVKYVINVNGEKYEGETVIRSGEKYRSVEQKITLRDFGRYDYSIHIDPLIDIDPNNNVLKGTLEIAKARAKPAIGLSTAIPVVFILLVFIVVVLLLLKRRT